MWCDGRGKEQGALGTPLKASLLPVCHLRWLQLLGLRHSGVLQSMCVWELCTNSTAAADGLVGDTDVSLCVCEPLN